jgi:predicted Zn-dependent protease
MGWSRREVLAALAAAGAAPGWSALLSACGGTRPAPAVEPRDPVPAETIAGLRDQLRQVAADLARRFRSVALRAELGRATRVVVEPEERGFDQRGRSSLVLAGFDGAAWFEQATSDLSRDAIAAAASALSARAVRRAAIVPRAVAPAGRAARAATGSIKLGIDPRDRPIADWLERAARLQERAAKVGGSRLVYRATAIEVDDSDVLFVGDGRDLAQRLVRTRARVLFLAWTGAMLAAEEASASGAFGLEGADLSGSEIERAAEGALTLLTSTQMEAGTRELLLDPSVAALLIGRGVARGFEGDAWVRGGARAEAMLDKAAAAEAVTLHDDPTAGRAYGGYRFDDEGWPAAPLALIERGVVRGALCDAAAAAALRRPRTGHGRRVGPLDAVEPRASHLVLAPGTRQRDDLIAAIDGQGYLIEGGVDGSGDPGSWRAAVRARRAREIARGRLTGRVYGPVVMAGEVPALLGAVRGLDRGVQVFGWRQRGAAISVATPSVLTRGWVGVE